MGKVICVNCGAKISFMGNKLKECPRCKKNPLVKEEVERFGSYSKSKKKKHFKDNTMIEETKDAGDLPEVQDGDGIFD